MKDLPGDVGAEIPAVPRVFRSFQRLYWKSVNAITASPNFTEFLSLLAVDSATRRTGRLSSIMEYFSLAYASAGKFPIRLRTNKSKYETPGFCSCSSSEAAVAI